MKTKKIYREFTPLDVAFSLWADGGALYQTYDANTNTFMPDREITPLTIRASLDITDKDKVITSGSKVSAITGINWYEIKNGTKTLIDSNNTNYAIKRDKSAYNGSIQIVKNHIAYDEAITLEFNGTYIDSRTNGKIPLTGTILLRTNASADAPLWIHLDSGRLFKFNPIEHPEQIKIAARMYLGNHIITDITKQKYWWYTVNETGIETLITGTNQDHIFYVSGSGTNSLTINCENIADTLQIRCKGEYLSETETIPETPGSEAYIYDTIISREYPLYEEELVVDGGIEVNPTQSTGNMAVQINTAKGVISDPKKYFSITYYQKPLQGGAIYQEIGQGNSAKFNANLIDSASEKAVELAVDVKMRPGYSTATDKSGNTLTDKDNNILIIR